MTSEIEYRYVKGQGWVAGYKDMQPVNVDNLKRILHEIRVTGVRFPPGDYIRTVRVTGTVVL